MDREQLIGQFKEMPWDVWLHRHFSPFVTYLLMKSGTPAGFKKIGLDGQFPIALYDTDDWYDTEEMYALAAKEAKQFLKQKNIFELTAACESQLELGRKEIPTLNASDQDPVDLFRTFLDIMEPASAFAWVAHAAEPYYYPLIREAASQYVDENALETFIGDISFPSKKNALGLMDQDMRAGVPIEKIHKKFSWIKARGGFRDGYTLAEMKELKRETLLEPAPTHPKVTIPEGVARLVREVQELVYMRTFRTDALWEMFHLATPLLERVARHYKVDSLKDYIPDELLSGTYEIVPHEYAIVKSYDDVIVVRESVVSRAATEKTEAHGVVAQQGFVKGVVKVLEHPRDVDKVEDGDVIVACMTNPSFIRAMHRAAAFVTDEGGITCHAAIIAREMKKPCVIGTKIATQIFSDGDVVEVDAEKGIVKRV